VLLVEQHHGQHHGQRLGLPITNK